MRLCFVCNEYPPGPHGGIGTSVQVLARAFVAAGHNVAVIGIYPHDYPGPDHVEDLGVRVYRQRRTPGSFGWIGDRLRLYRNIRKLAIQGAIDVVDVPDYEGMAAGWTRLPVPVTTRICGSQTYFAAEEGRPVKKAAYFLERASLRRSNCWCAKSHYAAKRTKELFGLRSGPHAVLYNPVESPAEFSAAERMPNRVVFTGTLVAKKGVMPLMKAWQLVRRECPTAELHMFGKDGRTNNGESMRIHLQKNILRDHAASVIFHGHVNRDIVIEELQKAQVAVFPSFAECFANAPLEAMACGCPTIYSTKGPGPELVQHNQTGLLIDPDRPAEIAAALVRLLKNRSFAHELGNAGRLWVRQEFSVYKVQQDNLRYYQDCIAQFNRDRQTSPVIFDTAASSYQT